MFLAAVVAVAALAGFRDGQNSVEIRVDAAHRLGAFAPVWDYFGYDEPNYTYAPNGRKLIGELSGLSAAPAHIRTHNLLTTGDGTSALKWGSTNAYTEDASGHPIYNWTIVDRIIDTYIDAGVAPFVEIGFMPKALSINPEPYQHTFPIGDVFTGWSYPPASYQKWGELVFHFVNHCVQKYGRSAAEKWDWEVWNEPDIRYWHGTPEEYDKLYDFTVHAVRRALPSARIGGPASTGPANVKAGAFLRQFLEHCLTGRNYVSGETGAPLDFISFHVKGKPETVNGHVRMGLSKELNDALEGFKIVRSFEAFRNLPIVLSEADPEGCAACSAKTNPQNAYRNGALYPSYTAVAMKALIELAKQERVNLQGVLTWAFEFEDQPPFEGFRTLATQGIDKPVLNVFRMFGLMNGDRVGVESSGAAPIGELTARGVRQKPEVDALGVRSDHKLSVMIWNYQDEDVSGASSDVKLRISGLDADAERVLLQHYRIDAQQSNSYTEWQRMGSPKRPTASQQAQLEEAGQLQLLESPRWMKARSGSLDIRFSLPVEGISLIELSW